MVINRGAHEEIDVFPGFPLDNKLSGNVVDLCPVGALGDKDFLYQQRVWFMKKHAERLHRLLDRLLDLTSTRTRTTSIGSSRARTRTSTSGGCATKAATAIITCTTTRREIGPHRREEGDHAAVEWATLPDELAYEACRSRPAGRRALAASDGRRGLSAGQVGPQHRSGRRAGPGAGAGGRRRRDVQERLHDSRREVPQPPRRRSGDPAFQRREPGLRRVLARSSTAARSAASGSPAATRADWIDEATAERLQRARLLIVQDMFASPLWDRADYQLPGASFAERDGSYVNYADRLQSFEWADPSAGGRVARRPSCTGSC